MANAAPADCPGGLPDAVANLRISEDQPREAKKDKARRKRKNKKPNKMKAASDEAASGHVTSQVDARGGDERPSGEEPTSCLTATTAANDEDVSGPPTLQVGARIKDQKGPSRPTDSRSSPEKVKAPTDELASGPPMAEGKGPPRQKSKSPPEKSDALKDSGAKGSSVSQTDAKARDKGRSRQKRRSSQNKGDAPIDEVVQGSSASQADATTKVKSPAKQKPRADQNKPQKLPSTQPKGVYGPAKRGGSPRRTGGRQPPHQARPGDFRMCALDPLLTLETIRTRVKDGTCVEGTLRVNQRNSEDAYVTLSESADGGKCQWDIHLEGSSSRGRALNGDQVAVELLPREKWKIHVKAIQQWEADNKISLHDSVRNGEASPDAVADPEEVPPKNCDLVKASSEGVNAEACDVLDGKACDAIDGVSLHQAEYPLDVIFSHSEWGRFVQRTGRVVGIVAESGPRVGCGHLRRLNPEFWHQSGQQGSTQQNQQGQQQQQQRPMAALFVPQDKRFPHLWIPAEQCPANLFQRPQDFSNILVCARLEQWPDLTDPNGHWELPRGQLLQLIGKMGDVEAETVAILTGQMIDFEEYTEDVLDDLSVPVSTDWTIPPKELESRRDFRRQLVISIDPSTARDLDDALSVRCIDDDLYEVGVHIADLSYFIPPGCKLDKKAQHRATSVYLVQKVIPMLPRILCDNLCSLTAGSDRLTFSVVWKMNAQGEVFDEWFGRSVINSCCQLSYEHAQQMIDSPCHKWRPEELPNVHGCWQASDISEAVNILNKMAIKMRERRVANGCLRLDQIRLQFALADDGTTPQGYSVYEHSESHKLIEEFMLQANMAVAHRLVKCFPVMAFLRNHPPPDWRRLETTVRSCSFKDLDMDGKTSGGLQKSLFNIVDSSNRFEVVKSISARLGRTDGSSRDALMSALCNVLSKPFRPASYVVAGSLPSPDHYRHFALAVPLYTHFTSPIRRYADLVVHRLLAASLDLVECPYKEVAALQRVAVHCNERKYAAKTAQELSVELFVWTFISKLPSRQMKDDFIVVGAFDKAVDVMSLSTGLVLRAYVDKQGVSTTRFSNDPDCLVLVFESTRGRGHEESLKLTSLSPVQGVVTALPNMGKYLVTLNTPPNAIRGPIGDQSGSQSARTSRFAKPEA